RAGTPVLEPLPAVPLLDLLTGPQERAWGERRGTQDDRVEEVGLLRPADGRRAGERGDLVDRHPWHPRELRHRPAQGRLCVAEVRPECDDDGLGLVRYDV